MTLTTLVLAANPVEHVINHKFIVSDGWWLWSGHVGNLLLSGLIMLLAFPYLASKIATGHESLGHERYVARGKLAHMLEVICIYLRDNTIKPMLGHRTNAFLPYLWTLFFFILINNLLGLIPIGDLIHLVVPSWKASHSLPFGGTATQNLFVTGILALISALVINIAGVRELGLGGYAKHLTAGTPPYLWALMIPIEVMGTLIKPVALALRLFANMTAGHILLATLLMFAVQGLDMLVGKSPLIGAPVTIVSVAGAIAITFLELFVAFLQAFVFMFLTTVFIAQLSHHDEEHGHGHEHAHAH
ncbi:MAG: F0F1 ATP synthase subunit A [Phycisphaerae bacterium]|nr:F0F1 ATP synthase subunit A [Phycisphaerae bacterium]